MQSSEIELPQSLVDLFTEEKGAEPTRQISFLLGSGFSRTDGMPLMRDINQRLINLTTDEFYLAQDGQAGFYSGKDQDANERTTIKDKEFAVRFIRFYIYSELEGNSDSFDYEKFFDYFSDFMNDKHKADEICAFCDEFLQGKDQGFNAALQLVLKFLNVFNQLIASLLSKAKYFGDITWNGGYPLYEHFCSAIGRILKQRIVNVHTLNHDLLFDFMGRSMSGFWEYFTDGFSEMESKYYGDLLHTSKINNEILHKTYKVRVPAYTNQYDNRLRLFKLHGSVNYYALSLEDTREQIMIKRDYAVGEISLERYNNYSKKFDYDAPFSKTEPSYLTGTTNKIRRYGDYFYANIFEHFCRNLQVSELLIVIGYGFKDSGINEILERDFLQHGKRIMVIDVRRPEADIINQYPDQFDFQIESITDLPYQVYLWFCEVDE